MKSKSLKCVSVAVGSETEEAVCELMSQVFDSPAVVFNDLEARQTWARVYVELTQIQWTKKKRRLRAEMDRLTDFGISLSPLKITCRQVRAQDWSESWKRHFKPIEIGDRLLVKPSWSKKRACRNAEVVILDPGLSFGTGQHPTTHFCLEQIVKARTNQPQRLLDIGTGSGILAIAAAKLSYRPVIGFDFDSDAVRIAKSNATANDVTQIRLLRKDLTGLRTREYPPFDVVCANLTADLLISQSAKIMKLLKKNGTLILAGILNNQFREVAKIFRHAGMKLLDRCTKDEWTSGSFRFDD